MKTKYIAIITGAVFVITVTMVCMMQKASADETSKQPRTKQKQIIAAKHSSGSEPVSEPAAKKANSHKTIAIKKKIKPTLQKVPQIIQQPAVTVAKPQSTLFSTNYLEAQEFNLPFNTDTEIVAKEGMKVSIPANAFVTKSGKPVNGRIKFEVKEAFTPQDIVMANLVTKKGKDLLESGGMFYLNATSNNEELVVAEGKKLGIEVPTPTKEKGMELYKGLQTESGLDWTEPLAMNDDELVLKEKPLLAEAKIATRTIYNDDVIVTGSENTVNSGKKIGRIKEKAIDKIAVKRDSLGWIAGITKTDGMMGGNNNHFSEDHALSYLMQTNRMGWANIDRLCSDPRSRRVNFVTMVENNTSYQNVYISMLFKSKRIYLPGYQKADGTYSFTHGDYEAPVLPVGETAFIMVSAYKNNEHFFSMQQIEISDNTAVTLSPVKATEDEIKAEVNKSL
ncbi:MAG: hypothetical protein JST26_18975 [Bacteroidetes bacterium]|nr:hypothetical protein [Bacteroidota bacterium]